MTIDLKQKHVLLVVHQFFPKFRYGTEKYTLDLAHGLKELSYQVTVLTMSDNQDAGNVAPYTSYQYEGINVIAINHVEQPLSRFGQSYTRSSFHHLYREILRELKPDIIHCCHLLNHSLAFLDVAKFFGVPIVKSLTDFWLICWTGQLITHGDNKNCSGPGKNSVNCVDDFFNRKNIYSNSKFFKWLLELTFETSFRKTLLQFVSLFPKNLREHLMPGYDEIKFRNNLIKAHVECVQKFLVPTKFMAERFTSENYPSEKLISLSFGISQPSDSEIKALASRFELSNLAERSLRVGFIGQLMPHKGADLLIRAFKKITAPQISLVIYGDLAMSSSYSELLKQLVAEDARISFAGTFNHDHIYQILSEIDLLVIPSIWQENSPLVLLNALASKTPVAISNAKGMTEFVEEGRQGFIFEMGDIEGIYKILNSALENPELLDQLANSHPGYPISKLEYTKSVATIYEELLISHDEQDSAQSH